MVMIWIFMFVLLGVDVSTGGNVTTVMSRCVPVVRHPRDEREETNVTDASLSARFEEHRPRLRAVAYRLLGSMTDSEDAVQETWLRVTRAEAGEVDNLGGWLTTVITRVCLDVLRARKTRENAAPALVAEGRAAESEPTDPEREVLLADAVGSAMMVVLDTLSPPERVAFVLHDLFALSFEDVGAIVGRSADATRQLASRARRRVQRAGERAVCCHTDHEPPRSGHDERRMAQEAHAAETRVAARAHLLAPRAPQAVRVSSDPAEAPRPDEARPRHRRVPGRGDPE
jgi:RNA polymerase sigma-70 factor (ECF subfamily)